MVQFGFTRFLILALATCCITSILSNMNVYNFAKICRNKTPDANGNYTLMNDKFTKFEQSVLQSSVAIGALLASIPYTIFFQKFTSHTVFLSAGIISLLGSGLVPLFHSWGFIPFLFARVLQGVGFSATFPLMGSITANWATLHEHGIFLGLLTGCTQLSNVITMPLSGALCETSWGWPAAFYAHALIGLVVFTLWIVLYKDHPSQHFLVAKKELTKIGEGKGSSHTTKKSPVPYAKVLRSKSILGSWIAAFGDLICIQLVSMYNPIYMRDFLRFSVVRTGFLAALPIVIQWLFKVSAGAMSDAIKSVSETTKTKIFNSIALGVSGIFFVVLAFIPRHLPIVCMVMMVGAVSFLGFNTAGFNKCATLHSRQHSHFAMTQIMNIWALTILIEPFIVDPFLTDYTSAFQWKVIFLAHAVLLFASNGWFVWWADARPASWTMDAPQPSGASEEVRKSLLELEEQKKNAVN